MRGDINTAPIVKLSDLFDLNTTYPSALWDQKSKQERYVAVRELPHEVCSLFASHGFYAQPLKDKEFHLNYELHPIKGKDDVAALTCSDTKYVGTDLVGIVSFQDIRDAAYGMAARLHKQLASEAVQKALKEVSTGIASRYLPANESNSAPMDSVCLDVSDLKKDGGLQRLWKTNRLSSDPRERLVGYMKEVAEKSPRLRAIAQGPIGFPPALLDEALQSLLDRQDQEVPIVKGMAVQSQKGERDSGNGDGFERFTGQRAWGMLTERDDHNGQWKVVFENGTTVFITDQELADRRRYEIKYNGAWSEDARGKWRHGTYSHECASDGRARIRLKVVDELAYEMVVMAYPSQKLAAQESGGASFMDVRYEIIGSGNVVLAQSPEGSERIETTHTDALQYLQSNAMDLVDKACTQWLQQGRVVTAQTEAQADVAQEVERPVSRG